MAEAGHMAWINQRVGPLAFLLIHIAKRYNRYSVKFYSLMVVWVGHGVGAPESFSKEL